MQGSECLNPYIQNTSKIVFGSLVKGLATKRRAHWHYTSALQASKQEQMLGPAVSQQGRS